MITGRPVWQWDSDDYFRLSESLRAALDGFVRAHGIAPDTVMVGNSLAVIDADDGSGFWLRTWRAVRDSGDLLICPHCPACVQQVKVTVRLVSPPPVLPGAFHDPTCGLRLAEVSEG